MTFAYCNCRCILYNLLYLDMYCICIKKYWLDNGADNLLGEENMLSLEPEEKSWLLFQEWKCHVSRP